MHTADTWGNVRGPPSLDHHRGRAHRDGGPAALRLLTASITWQVSWEGSGGTGGDLPDGTFETTQDMTVQEIQSINR
ncbi:hypothetical protein ABZS79_09485 [Streptomyces griseoloalbus]|uniref:hypothetical protein n=1 Tax=Streptomyces griseoloalbus TaxID=67303 RepID=UPI0033AB5DEE